jgi:intein/homing endonuclease
MDNWVFPIKERFKLSDKFIEQYKGKQPNWGPLGYVTFKRSYARTMEDGSTEEFWQTVQRVVEACYTTQLQHVRRFRLPWDARKSQKSAQEMYRLIFEFKFLPPGRGLYMFGTDHVWQRGAAPLFNCCAITTKNIDIEGSFPFTYLMDMSMLGVGVGFDTDGAGKVKIVEPKSSEEVFVVEDSKEGWVSVAEKIIDAYFGRGKMPKAFDYSLIRPAGSPIRGFGGIAPGSQPLERMERELKEILQPHVGTSISSVLITDVMNILGKAVVSGGIRRCLPEGTEVHTKRGLIPIEEVKVGDEVVTTSGFRKVLENVYQGLQPMVDIVTQMGSFRCTPQHRMKVFKGIDEFEWKQAKDLKPEDRLVYFNETFEMGDNPGLPSFQYIRPPHSTTCKDIIIPELDEDMAWFFGYLHGNGYINAKEVNVSVPATTPEVRERISAQLRRFGINVREHGPYPGNNVLLASAKSRQLALYLGQFKQANTTISVPDFIKRSSRSLKEAYLLGLYDSDGAACNRPILLVTSVYPFFLAELQNLYASIGICTRIKRHKSKTRPDHWKTIYHLNVVGERYNRRADALLSRSPKYRSRTKGFSSRCEYSFPLEWVGKYWPNPEVTECRAERLLKREINTTPVKVLDVVPVDGEEETYDLSVEGNHEFVCGPGLVSHNTAEIGFGYPDDIPFMDMKDPEKNGDLLLKHRWAANLSIIADVGMDYTQIAERLVRSGEPGVFWREQARHYGRMKDGYGDHDLLVTSTNPCGEVTLQGEGGELCNIADTFPAHHDSLEEFLKTIKYAFLYCKTVTLIPTHQEKTNQVIWQNRRIGLSQSGIVQSFQKHGRRTHMEWCDEAYEYLKKIDKQYSSWLGIPRSIKLTTIKPAGTTSLLCGATPGVHYPHSEYYKRAIRIDNQSPLVKRLQKAGYPNEPSVYGDNTVVFYFPVHERFFDRSKKEVTLWEQLENVAQLQATWSDNAVSCTVTFDVATEGKDIKRALELYETRLKGVTFLPTDDTVYQQAPYQEITKQEFERMVMKIKPLDLSSLNTHEDEEKFCDGDKCQMPTRESVEE